MFTVQQALLQLKVSGRRLNHKTSTFCFNCKRMNSLIGEITRRNAQYVYSLGNEIFLSAEAFISNKLYTKRNKRFFPTQFTR